eukprot:s1198_g18.t6
MEHVFSIFSAVSAHGGSQLCKPHGQRPVEFQPCLMTLKPRLWAACVLLPAPSERQEIRCVACSSNCRFLALACHSGQVYLFHCDKGQLKPLALSIAGWLGPDEVHALGFCKAPSGLKATAGCEDLLVLLASRLRLLDVKDGSCIATLPSQAEARLMVVLEDGRHAVLGGDQLWLIDLWSSQQRSLGGRCERLAAPSAAFSGQGLRFAAQDRELKLWLADSVASSKGPTTPSYIYNFSSRGPIQSSAVALAFEDDLVVLVLQDRLLFWTLGQSVEFGPVQISRAYGEPLGNLAGGTLVRSASTTSSLMHRDSTRMCSCPELSSLDAGGSEPRLLLWSTSGQVLQCLVQTEEVVVLGHLPMALLAGSGLFGVAIWQCLSVQSWLIVHEASYFLAAWAHLACALSDPGAVPRGAAEVLAPEPPEDENSTAIRWCKHCQLAKPPRAHHCSTCQRCIRKMDHHCMWMNNCIGANNQKHFLLFLTYTSLHCLGVVPMTLGQQSLDIAESKQTMTTTGFGIERTAQSLWCLFALHPPPGEENPLYAAVSLGSILSLLLAGCLGRYSMQLLNEQSLADSSMIGAAAICLDFCVSETLCAWRLDGRFYAVVAQGGALHLCVDSDLCTWRRCIELGALWPSVVAAQRGSRLTLSAVVPGANGPLWLMSFAGPEVLALPLLLDSGKEVPQEARLALPEGFGTASCALGLSSMIAVGSSRGTLAWWSTSDWKLLGSSSPAHAAGVLHLARVWIRPSTDDSLVPEASLLAALDEMGKCRLVDLSKGEALCTIQAQMRDLWIDQPLRFIYDPVGGWISAMNPQKVWTWDITSGVFAHSRKLPGTEERKSSSLDSVCWQAAEGSASTWQLGEVMLDGPLWKLPVLLCAPQELLRREVAPCREGPDVPYREGPKGVE